MNYWLLAAICLSFCLIPCLLRTLRGDALTRLIGLETGGLIEAQILLLLNVALHRTIFYDLALALALLDLAGGLVFVHFLERWM